MTHPNHQTNGASLEDCHTNFFALTDLCGIKWRKLVGCEAVGAVEPLDDPVLHSYSRCLANDILCVWRRVSTTGSHSSSAGLYDLGVGVPPQQSTNSTPNPPLSLHAAKELWIFWYGEEPDLSELVAQELISPDSEQGSWESGLSYECRSLLFKALHNLIERCLLSRDFVRLGKWFVQPYEGPRKNIGPSTTHLSFSFAFFVHGESTVCASVDVRQHPAVRRLTKQHILQAQTTSNGLPVILAPFGLSASLTGTSCKPDTPNRVLDDWAHFYPVEHSIGPPSCVEVVVGGVKLRYPSCYVLLTDMDEPSAPVDEGQPPPALQGPAGLLPERVWQDAVLGGPAKQPGEWEFVEPTRRTNCTCSKCRKVVGPGKAGGRSKGPRRVPFHRRTPPPPNLQTQERYHQGSCTPQGGPPSYPRTQDSLTVPSVGSPPSVAPSPQPASVPAGGEAPAPTPPITTTAGGTPPPASQQEGAHQTPDGGHLGGQSPPNTPGQQIGHSTKHDGGMLKRPVLSMKEYEDVMLEEEQTLDLLYDYSTLDAWLNHPVKRFKPDSRENRLKHKHGDIYSLYGTPNGVSSNNNSDSPALNGSTQLFIKQEIKQEPFPLEMESSTQPILGGKRPGDPYEFEEEGGSGVQMDFKRGQIKEENKEIKKCPAGNLFTSEGLQPSYKDLDQIFDNSDDTSSDEALQVQTPPGSNKSLTDDSKRLCPGGPGILRPEELSKMFPTPPSLEHPVASPQLEPSIDDSLKSEYPQLGSPIEEHIDDWSFVFKPNLVCKMVGSSKYAPLTNLPSSAMPVLQIPSNLVYKPSWVDKPRNNNNNNNNNSESGVQNNNQNAITFPQSPMHSFRAPPPPYELSSPATSNASSYLNKNLNSVEPIATPNIKTPEANSLLVNLLLGDTSLNIFRDHNFDSCTLCVCNAGPKCVGNIKGADAQLYLSNGGLERGPPVSQPQPSSPFPGIYGMLSPPQHDEDNIRCSCGFSAVVNRKLSHRSGLFYEDEMEITGIAEDPSERKKGSLFSFFKLENSMDRDIVDQIPQTILELVREQCVMLQSTSNSLYRASKLYRGQNHPPYSTTINILEFTDSNEMTTLALDSSKLIDTQILCKLDHAKSSLLCVHKWPFLRANGPTSHQDIVRVMKTLQPLLQEAIQKKCTTRLWEAPYTVKGPLTWRQFHRLAGRGTDDRCEPQPIPSLIVGHDKDWLSLSPYALQFWDRLLLEPYSYSRDVAYIVVAPDNEAILPRVRSFFKELSTAYEVCRLGRHSPITKVLRDGILRVGKNAKTKLANEPIEEWFAMLGEGDTTDMIKLYAQACKHHLAPHLLQVPMDKTLLDPPDLDPRPSPSPMPPPSTPDMGDKAPSTPKTNPNPDTSDSLDTSQQSSGDRPTVMTSIGDAAIHDEDEKQPPSVVVYLVEPFTMGSDHQDLQRLACVALLRCFQSVLQAVPEHIRTNISVQIISQESIVELGRARERNRQSDHMRALALSIFSQCRRLLVHSSNVKSLTGFGTAAMADLFLKSKDEKNRAAYKMYTPPYVLAPLKERAESAESFGQASAEQCSVLYLSYCLSEDQSLILAVATDERGEICETVTINIDVPNRSRRKKASARRIGLQKLMDFILGVMSQSVQPWRLVVGRIGRIGHGELKGWSWLLSRKSLLKASKHLKELCVQCSLMYPQNVPCIMSACLVSLEPDSTLRLMPDQFTPDERFSQVSVNSQLSTPQDVTCTHILVFPTSATTQSSQTAFQETHINGPDLGDDELFNALNDDMPEGIDGMNDFNDIFSWPEAGQGGQSPTGSPRKEENSPARQSPFPCVARGGEISEEVGTLLQQPLALGYLVSTAPMGRMPRWFWASCPHLEGVCPAFLKNALHLHSPAIQQSSDDLLQQAAVTSHPLDSQYTTDVLRFVLEGYNALSWLALDSNTQDRLSCLPVHIQVLIQLYHLTASLL